MHPLHITGENTSGAGIYISGIMFLDTRCRLMAPPLDRQPYTAPAIPDAPSTIRGK
jgi:hypothetical protein